MATRKTWLDTAVDIQKVLSISKETDQVFLGGHAMTDNQLITFKTELALLAKMSVYPVVLESVKQQAINIGINSSSEWEHVLTSKAMLLLLQWMREWGNAIEKVQLKKKEV